MRGVGHRVASLVAFATVASMALPALAGTVQIKDSADALTSEQEAALQKSGGKYPFDVRVLTTDTATSKRAFESYVGQQVSEPNMVVVALDPQHRQTSVHFGTGTRIGAGEYRAIEDAGDSHFRDKDFAGGITAILDRATQAVGTGAVLEPSTRTTVAPGAAGTRSASTSSGIGTWIVLLGVGFIVVMVAMAFFRRRSAAQAGYGQGPNVGGAPPPGGGYGNQPNYGPQQGYGGGGSGLGGNLMSAGLGGLVGYEIGKATSEHHGSNDGGGSYIGGAGSDAGGGNDTSGYDAGGSTSDWSGGDSGGGGFDAGGGGGDFGGGGDSGGGGGDW